MKKIFKFFIWLILITIIVGGIVFALIPTILSSKSAVRTFLNNLESEYGGTYAVDELSLEWYGLQRATNIKIYQGEKLITAKEAKLRMSLFQMIALRKYPLELVFSGDLEINDAEVHLGQNTSLTNINFIANNEKREMHITGQCQTDSKDTGNFEAHGTEGHPWNWKGKATNFPSSVISLFYPEVKAPPLIGKNFNVDFTFENQLLDVNFLSPKLQFSTEGKLSNSKFMLGKRTDVNYVLDKDASDLIFKDTMIKPVSAKTITLKIEPQNAHFNFDPFEASSVYADYVTLDLGQMIFRNYGTLSDLLTLIKMKLRPNNDVPLWFQEMPISISKGIATIQRSEILVDNTYDISFWGKLDFVEEEANTYLGLNYNLLMKVFKLQTIGKNYTIPVKVDGHFSDLKLHKSGALAEIMKVLAAEKIKSPILPTPSMNIPPNDRQVPWN